MRLVSAVTSTLLLLAVGTLVSAQSVPYQSASYTSKYYLWYNKSDDGAYTYRLGSDVSYGQEREAVTVQRNPDVQGWDYIRFNGNSTFLQQALSEAYYAAGYAEGLITAPSIYNSYITAMSENGSPTLDTYFANGTRGYTWLTNHVDHMRTRVATNSSTYWQLVGAMLRQIDGLTAGYNAAIGSQSMALTWNQMFFVSFQSEMYRAHKAADAIYAAQPMDSDFLKLFPNLAELLGAPKSADESDATKRTHCSALIRVTADDVFLGHDTWSSYNTMVRQYKTYALFSTVTMSGYPGSLSSIDDFYMTSNGLAVTETSIDLATDSLDSLIVPQCVSEFIRVMVANYYAATGPDWTLTFAYENSGTYNNQYMVLDTNLASQALAAANASNPGSAIVLPNNTFWLLEQSPVIVERADMTWFLNDNGYWPSYNIPYFQTIANRSGYTALAQQKYYGVLNNYTTYSRAKLFANHFKDVVDKDSMYRLMRRNEYQTDPESVIPWCSQIPGLTCAQTRTPMFAIASRGDLAPTNPNAEADTSITGGNNAAASVSIQNLGAIDTKFTSVRMMTATAGLHSAIAINGPTYESQPPFNSTAFQLNNQALLAGTSWNGVPQYFNFLPVHFVDSPQTHAPTMAPTPAPDTSSDDDSKKTAGIVVGTIAGVGVVGAGGAFAFKKFGRTRVGVYEGEDRPLV